MVMSDGSFISHSSQYLCEVDHYYNNYLSPTWWINWISKIWITLLKITCGAYIVNFESGLPVFVQSPFNELSSANGLKYDFLQ